MVVLVHFYLHNEHHHLKELKNLDQDFFSFSMFLKILNYMLKYTYLQKLCACKFLTKSYADVL